LFGDGALSVIAEVAGRAFVMCAGVGALDERATGNGPADVGAAGTVSTVVAYGTLDIIVSTSSGWLQESAKQEESD